MIKYIKKYYKIYLLEKRKIYNKDCSKLIDLYNFYYTFNNIKIHDESYSYEWHSTTVILNNHKINIYVSGNCYTIYINNMHKFYINVLNEETKYKLLSLIN